MPQLYNSYSPYNGYPLPLATCSLSPPMVVMVSRDGDNHPFTVYSLSKVVNHVRLLDILVRHRLAVDELLEEELVGGTLCANFLASEELREHAPRLLVCFELVVEVTRSDDADCTLDLAFSIRSESGEIIVAANHTSDVDEAQMLADLLVANKEVTVAQSVHTVESAAIGTGWLSVDEIFICVLFVRLGIEEFGDLTITESCGVSLTYRSHRFLQLFHILVFDNRSIVAEACLKDLLCGG